MTSSEEEKGLLEKLLHLIQDRCQDAGPSSSCTEPSPSLPGGRPEEPPAVEAASAITSYTSAEYLSTERKFSYAKKIFRSALKRAAKECRVWGIKSFKDLTPGELRHIFNEVVTQCPPLVNNKMEIEKLLSSRLAQAKSFKKKKKLSSDVSKNNPPTSDRSSHETGKKKKQKKHSVTEKSCKGEKKSKKRRRTEAASSSSSKKSKKEKRSEAVSSSSSDNDSCSSSDEECVNSKLKHTEGQKQRTMTSAVHVTKNVEQTGLGQVRPGTQVAVLNSAKITIATATFLFKENDLYSKLAFVASQESEGSDELHELPHPVGSKMSIEDLQVDDIFLWKHTKICSASEVPHAASYEERSTRRSRGSKPMRFRQD